MFKQIELMVRVANEDTSKVLSVVGIPQSMYASSDKETTVFTYKTREASDLVSLVSRMALLEQTLGVMPVRGESTVPRGWESVGTSVQADAPMGLAMTLADVAQNPDPRD